MQISVTWAAVPWYSRYHKGTITGSSHTIAFIESIWKHGKTGKVRFYSSHNFDHVSVEINGHPVHMRARGRFGRLYIQQ